jgi:Na+-transporting methylmalonyl-CoA/oxaloacetate decarboxylase gamma subunit
VELDVDDSLVTALVISAIGMTLLFLSLILFYGIISLLTAATREKPSTPPGRTDGAEEQRDALADRALQAAAIAVALARAEAEGEAGKASGSVSLAPGNRDVTPWWSLHHQHRLAGKGKPRRPW